MLSKYKVSQTSTLWLKHYDTMIHPISSPFQNYITEKNTDPVFPSALVTC